MDRHGIGLKLWATMNVFLELIWVCFSELINTLSNSLEPVCKLVWMTGVTDPEPAGLVEMIVCTSRQYDGVLSEDSSVFCLGLQSRNIT